MHSRQKGDFMNKKQAGLYFLMAAALHNQANAQTAAQLPVESSVTIYGTIGAVQRQRLPETRKDDGQPEQDLCRGPVNLPGPGLSVPGISTKNRPQLPVVGLKSGDQMEKY